MTEFESRMLRYEAATKHLLPRRIPIIVRVDGRAFHGITGRLYGRTWSAAFTEIMASVALAVVKDMQGCTLAYGQSDEISFLLTDYRTINTHGWFAYELNKVLTISAGLASGHASILLGQPVTFDSRAFPLPMDEVCNYFVYRQRDATRNAINMAGQEHFSPSQLNGKNTDQVQEMLFQQKAINFNDYPIVRKRGFCIVDGAIDLEPPIFSQDRQYIERHVFVRED